jgi:hypothetical protein
MDYNNLIYVQFSIIGAVVRAAKRNFAMRNKSAVGPQGQTETSLKIEDLSWKYPKKWKKLNKMSMAKANGPVWDSRPPSSLSGPRTDVPPEYRPLS